MKEAKHRGAARPALPTPEEPKSKTICRSSGRSLKATGLRAVAASAGPWMEYALDVLESFPPGSVITMEAIRKKCKRQPHHPNAWGAVMNCARHRGLIRREGWKLAERREAHCRMLAMWRRCE